MSQVPLYKKLYKLINEELDLFGDKQGKFFSILANPGSGKTYTLIKTLEYFYGQYYTKNEFQKYKQDDGNELIIPAGEGNLAEDNPEAFALKTRNGTDVYWANRDKRALIVAYNTDIKKDFEKKVKNSNVLKIVKDKLNVRTSHSLLFKLAEHLNMFPKKNELGEYVYDNGIKVNFAKGSFTVFDIKKVLNYMADKKYSFIKDLDKKEYLKLQKVIFELISTYYQSDILITDEESVNYLYEVAQRPLKDIEENIKDYINSFGDAQNFYQIFLIHAVKTLKFLIKQGEIELCHDFYYKEVFVKCLKDEENLFKLFCIDNNPETPFDVIMVDEAQDLTPIMTRLLIEYYKFTKRNGIDVAFTIVGDRKQAIYAFANRIDAFEVIERELGKDKVQYFTLNESYRMSPSVCNFTNNLCKKLGIYKEREKIIPALPEKRGTVFNEYLNLENVCEYALKENEKLLILGRTNAEILVKYLELYFYFKNAAPQELKYIKLDSKIKSQFKKLLKNGFENGIDDTLKEKLMLLTGKEKFTINDLKDESIMEKLPLFLQKYIELSNKFTDEEMLEALNLRSSPKALIQLMTLHSSKGLEAENVYVLDGILETIDLNNKNGKTLKEKLEVKLKIKEQSEELRLIEAEKFLLYVGVTRAKRNLFLDKELLNAFKKAIQNVNNKEIEQKIKDFLLEKVIDKTIISTNDDPTVKTKTKLKK